MADVAMPCEVATLDIRERSPYGLGYSADFS
jgi:hypothetical protein